MVESVMLCVEKSWMLTNAMCRRLDGTCTRMLRPGVVFTWREWKKNNELYGELSNVTSVLKVRRLKYTGHLCRRKQKLVCQMLRFSSLNEKDMVDNKHFWKTVKPSMSEKVILKDKHFLKHY